MILFIRKARTRKSLDTVYLWLLKGGRDEDGGTRDREL